MSSRVVLLVPETRMGLVVRKSKPLLEAWDFSSSWGWGKKEVLEMELSPASHWFNNDVYAMVPPQHLINPWMIGFRKLPSWWAPWGAGRMVHPARAWKCHTLLSPEYLTLNISSTWLFLCCGHFSKLGTVSKWIVFLTSISCSSWDFWGFILCMSSQPAAKRLRNRPMQILHFPLLWYPAIQFLISSAAPNSICSLI